MQHPSLPSSFLRRPRPHVLHAREREAIVLAGELHAHLLIDEQRRRNMATALGRTVLGSVRMFINAKRRGLIDRAHPLLETMQRRRVLD